MINPTKPYMVKRCQKANDGTILVPTIFFKTIASYYKKMNHNIKTMNDLKQLPRTSLFSFAYQKHLYLVLFDYKSYKELTDKIDPNKTLNIQNLGCVTSILQQITYSRLSAGRSVFASINEMVNEFQHDLSTINPNHQRTKTL